MEPSLTPQPLSLSLYIYIVLCTYMYMLCTTKPLTVWITINHGRFWNRWEYQTTWPASWETWMQVRKQQLELDMEQQTGSKSGKEYIKVVYCYPAYLTSMQSTSWETLGWMKHKLESRLPGEISITSDMQMTPPYGRKWRGTKEFLLAFCHRVVSSAYLTLLISLPAILIPACASSSLAFHMMYSARKLNKQGDNI